MRSLKNSVQLIGHIGNTPEINTLENGNKVAKLSIATNETYKNKEGEKITQTEWHNLVAWNGVAEIIEKFAPKGKEIAIEGKLTTRSWDDKDGAKRYKTEIVVNEIMLFGGK